MELNRRLKDAIIDLAGKVIPSRGSAGLVKKHACANWRGFTMKIESLNASKYGSAALVAEVLRDRRRGRGQGTPLDGMAFL